MASKNISEMTNSLSKKYKFQTYEGYGETIFSCAQDFKAENDMYPNILFANSITFRRLSEEMRDRVEYSDDDDDVDVDIIYQPWNLMGIVSPKFKDTETEMGGYIWNEFSIIYSIDEEIGGDEFELQYIHELEQHNK